MTQLKSLHRLLAILCIFSAPGVYLAQTTAVPEALTTDVLLNLAKTVEGLKQQLTAIESRLTTLQATVEQKSTSSNSRCWVRSIAEAIRGAKHKIAEEELTELNQNAVIPTIVHDVYADSPTNVDIILDFGRTVRSAETKFLIFSALREEMRASGYSDTLKLIVLANELQRLSKLKNAEMTRKVQILIDDLIEDIKGAASSSFKAAMIASKFRDNPQVDSLATALFDFRAGVSDAVMEEVVDKVFGVVAAETMIENISSYRYIQQVVTGLAAIYNRFNFAANLNNDVIVKLASSLRQLQMRENYGALSQNLKDDVDDLVRRLPTCVSNFFFAKKVCLWNKGKNMYLYAGDSSISYNSDRRNVFVQAGDPKPGASWFVEQNGTDVYFINADYENEYLYPAGIVYDDDMRHVFTWIPGNNREAQSTWSMELDGEYCYLKSLNYKEYLFASSIRYNDKNSYVFTSITGKGVKSAAEYQWQLTNCTHIQA